MSGSFALVKLAVHVVSGLGVTKIINDVVANNTNIVTNFDAVRVTAGSLVFSSMAVDQASKHVEERLNQAKAWWEKKKDENSDLTRD